MATYKLLSIRKGGGMLGRVIEWMYPTVCPVCQKVLGKGKIICDTCKDELHIINEPRCAKCGKPLTDSGKTYCNDCKKMKRERKSI